uniref:Uncharacterized protein n=1 Tax=viral metagenome TaxID=1070528 RepID=A0A6C0ACD4_9ZZZZ
MIFKGLNKLYFSKVGTKDSYEIIKCKETPHLILFSRLNGIPLASISLRSQETLYQSKINGTRGKSLISHLPSDKEGRQRVQGLIDQNNQKFELVISNLLPGNYNEKKDYINFNILKTNEKVTETNPGGVNQVNELRPNESYSIKSDYTEGNKCLILSSLNKEDDGMELTIKEDEEQAKHTGKSTKGTYLYLSVVPQIGSKYAGLFEDTIWKSCEYFVRKEVHISNNDFTSSYFKTLCNNMNNNHHLEGQVYNEEILNDYDDFDDFDDFGDFGGFNNVNSKKETFPLPKNTTFFTNSNINLKRNNTFTKANNEFRSLPVMPNNVVNPFKANSDQDIYNSKASKIKHGEVIKVNSCETNIMYDFNKFSHPIVMGLSVMENLKFNPELNDKAVLELSKPLVDSLISFSQVEDELEKQEKRKHFLSFIENEVYDQNMCVLTMDEDDKPDTILYTCGHKCIKYENLSKDLNNCPICRTRILAYLRVNKDTEEDLSYVAKDVKGKTEILC